MPSRRIIKRIAIACGAFVALLALVGFAATLALQGERLGRVLAKVLPPMHGTIQVRAIRWRARLFVDLLTDHPTPLTVDGLRITDEEGVIVLDVPHLDVKVRVKSAIRGKIYLHDLQVSGGSLWRFAVLRKQPLNGFLSSFLPRKALEMPPPAPAPVAPAGDPFVFQIINAQMDGITAVFDFPAWGLELRNIKGPVNLTVDGNFVGWDGRTLDARDGGFLRVLTEVLPFDRVWINQVATLREYPDSIYLDVGAAKTGRSTTTAKGYFTEIYGYGYTHVPDPGIDMHAEIADAGDALGAVAAGHAIPGLRVSGRGAKLALDLKKPFARLEIDAKLNGIDAAFGAYQIRNLVARAAVVTDPLKLKLDELSFGSPGGGRFVLAADVAGTKAKVRARFESFATASYVPPALRRLAAGRLSGRIGLSGDFGPNKQLSLGPVELGFARARGGGLPGSARVTGVASASAQKIATSGIKISIPGASAEIRGEVLLARKMLNVALRASTSDLPQLLTGLGMQPLARGAALSVELDGPLDAPRARGEVVVQGIGVPGLPEVDQLTTRFHLQEGTLFVDSFGGQALGGTLDGHGELKLFNHTMSNWLRSPLLKFQLEGRDVELANLVALGWASGKISFVASAEGPLDRLHAHVGIPAGATLQVFGSSWELHGIEVEADAKTLIVRTARLARPSGAQIQVEGRMDFGGPMNWRVLVRDVAIAGLPGVAAAGVPVAGRLSADLTASGTLARPILAGEITLADVKARGVALGDGRLVIQSLGATGVTVKGNLFRRLDIDATALYGSAGTHVFGAVSFERLDLESLLPELASLGNGRGTATGKITVDFRPDAPLSVDARLSQLQVAITRPATDSEGRSVFQRIWLKNSGDLRVAITGEHIVLDEARLVTDGGEFRLRGELTGQTVRGALSGHLDLDLLQPFLRGQIRTLTGDLVVDLNVAGTTARPLIEGTVGIAHPVRVQMLGAAPEVVIPSGTVRLEKDVIRLSNLAVTVDDATLTLNGEAHHERFVPSSFEMALVGDVSASLLQTFASSAVSDAKGRAHIKARLFGTPAAPSIAARIDLGEIELRLRDLGRLITLESGTVELSNKELVLRDVKTRIDDQGRLSIGAAGVRPGRIALRSLYPKLDIAHIDLPMKGERLTYRVPNSVEIDDLGFNLALVGDLQSGLRLEGEALVMSGRYVQDFQMQNLVISPRIRESSVRPFYEGNELLADLGLDVRVRTVGDSFIVQNNLAPEIHVIMDLRVSGTLSDPRLAGNVRPTDGRFHILGLRGDFELVPNVNHVTFVETKSISEGETPELNLEAQNLVVDSSGGEHNVKMRIHGPIGQAAIDLSSDDGLDRNQALLLLVSGRTSDDASRFGSTQNPTIGSNFRTGTDMVGQVTRDTVGNLIEPYIDDTLQLLTGRKINLRPTVGADGFELKLLARLRRNTDLQLSYLRGFQSQQRFRGEGRLWLVDYVSARGFYERLTLSPQQGISEDVSSFNMELTLDIPLRLWRP